MSKPMRIEIVVNADNSFDIWQDGKTTGQLCLGEMLEQVIRMTRPNIGDPYAMHTPDEWEQLRLKRISKMEEIEKDFP